MAKKFLTDINIAGGVYDSSGDIGNSGQVLSSTGSGVNWINATSSASIVYQDGFTGDGSTTAFTLANSIDNENKTQVYIDGVYQHKDNYSLNGTTLTFSTAPPNTADIEVISFSSVSAADDILYDDDFTSAGLMTTNGSGVYSITTNNSSNWNTAYTYSQVGHLPLSGGAITGAITTNSTFDGRDISVDGTKLDGIEANATADQTDAEIRAAVEAATDSNVFTDADHSKLNGIEASADVTDTTNVTAAGALMDSEVTNLADVKAFDTTDYATAAQGVKADSAQQPPSEGAFVNGDKTKLDGIAAGAEVNVQSDWNSTSGDSLILNKPSIPSITGLASETYVDTAVSNLVDSAPGTLDTLNELAAALGDDANFSTTVTNSIATKLPLTGGTMTGDITISSTSPELKFVDTNSFTDTNDRWIVRGGADTLIMRWYDNSASSNTDALTLSSTAATFTGTITASGGNSGQWNTAYTYSQVGHLPLAGGTLTGALSGTSASFSGNVTGFGDFTGINTALNTRNGSSGVAIGNYTSAYAYIDLASTNSSFGSWIDFSKGDGQDYGGRIRYHNSDNTFTFTTGGSNDEFVIHTTYTYSPGSSRAPLFYDSNDTNYYVDPASTSISLNVAGRIQTSSTGTGGAPSLEINNPSSSAFIHSAEMLGANMTAGQANILVIGKEGTTKQAGYIGYNWAASGSNNNYVSIGHWSADHLFRVYGDSVLSTVTLRGDVDMQAPIFYHKGNTSFYVSPGNGSNGISANLQGRIQVGAFGGSQTNSGEAWIGRASDRSAGTLTVQLGTGTGRKFEVVDYNWTTVEFSANDSGVATAAGSFRAPIFYDSNDTGYYADLANTGTSVKGQGVSDMKAGFKSTANPWGTSDSAYFPNGISTAGGTNWVYGNTYIGNAPSNGAGHQLQSTGTELHSSSQAATSHGASGKWENTASSGGNFVPYSFENKYGNHSWGIVSRFRINTSVGDRPSIQFSHATNDTRWNIGYCAADDNFRVNQNMGYRNDNSTHDGWGTERFKIDTSGNIYSNGLYQSNASLRAPIFYDSNDTNYYVDPTANSVLTTATFNVNANSTISLVAAGTNASQIKAGAGDELYLGGNNTWQMRLSGGNILMDNGGYALSNGSMRAPIFYDSGDTAYYADINGLSHIRKIAGVRTNLATSEGWAEVNAWNTGNQTGYFGGSFTINGSSDENNISWEDGPSGTRPTNKKELVWKVTTNSSDSGADGGWNKTIGGINYNKSHISILYVKRVAEGNGNFYHGTTTCLNLSGTTNGNPYFQAISAQSLPLNVWCVSIGFLRANNDTASTAATSWSGIYRLDTGERILGATDFRLSQSTTSQHRCFLYYATNTASELWFANPGFYEINGNEPKLSEILMRPEDRTDSLRADVDMRAPLFYDSNNTSYFLDPAATSISLKAQGDIEVDGDIRGDYFVGTQYASEGYTIYKGYDNWNHMITIRGNTRPGQGKTQAAIVGAHITSFVEYAENNDTTGWWFTGSSGSTYAEVARITRSYSKFEGQLRSPIFYDSNNTGYYVDPASGTNLAGNVLITSGKLKVSTASLTYGTGYNFHNIENTNSNEPICVFYHSVGTTAVQFYGLNVISAAAHNNTTSRFFLGQGGGTERIKIYSNGNIQNSNNSYGQLSDINLKENIVDATSKLDEINQIRVVNFNYIGDIDEETNTPNKQIGVIAQEVEQIFPGLVYECGDTETTTKAVKYSVFVPMMLKAIQELKADNDSLKARIETLENN